MKYISPVMNMNIGSTLKGQIQRAARKSDMSMRQWVTIACKEKLGKAK